MTSTKILATSLCALLVAACSKDGAPSASTASPGTKMATAGAARVHGDLVPSSIVHVSLPKPGTMTLIHGSDALAPSKVFAVESPAMTVTGHDFTRTMQGDASKFVFPVDAPAGALVLVRTVDKTLSLTSVHMHDVATGLRLDASRDVTGSVGQRVDPTTGSALSREPGFAPLLLTRQLSFDVPYAGGLVQLDLPNNVMQSGVIVEVQEPNSRITLSAAPDEMIHGLGDTAQLHFSVASGDQSLEGATITGWAELSGQRHGPDFTARPLGNGQYVAQLPLTTLENVGTWGIHVTASGKTSAGVSYERSVETAFAFQPSHAQMTAIGVPVVVRGSDGLVDEVSVDVDVQTLEDDRFSVRGTLTFTAPDGTEHALAAAQTGQTINAGNGTITLHFTADSMALAQVAGPFHVRDVALVSQAFGLTQHRIGLGLGLVTSAIAVNEIRYPRTLSLQAQDLQENGDLPPAPAAN